MWWMPELVIKEWFVWNIAAKLSCIEMDSDHVSRR